MQIAQVDVHGERPVTLALGFGTDQGHRPRDSGPHGPATRAGAVQQLSAMAGRTTTTALESAGQAARPLAAPNASELERTYCTVGNVLKASEDKTFPGAIVASLASPWGQAVAAGDPAQTYFGSYREVFARDLYETFTGLLAAGDIDTAEDTVRFLFERQQLSDGSFPRNSLINGKLAPDSFGIQLDEVAYPILMARTVGLTDEAVLPRRTSGRPRTTSSPTARRSGQRAVGGAGRLVAVDHRGRDRRPRRRRFDRRSERRRGQAHGSTAPRPTTTSARSRAGR